MELLVPFAFRNSFKRVLPCITNFGKRAPEGQQALPQHRRVDATIAGVPPAGALQ
jgi:hypothetical protein